MNYIEVIFRKGNYFSNAKGSYEDKCLDGIEITTTDVSIAEQLAAIFETKALSAVADKEYDEAINYIEALIDLSKSLKQFKESEAV